MRSAVATRRQFLTVGGVALAGAVLSRSVVSEIVSLSSSLESSSVPSPLVGEGQGGGTSTTTALDRKSTPPNSSHVAISYAVFCMKKKSAANSPATTGP